MKKLLFLMFFSVFLLLSVNIAYSHGNMEEYNLDHSGLHPISQWQAVGYGSLIFSVLIIFILSFHKKMGNMTKKIVYFLVLIVVVAVTSYLVLTTLNLNRVSATKGPVHWHADYEIWVCGQELKIAAPKGFSNMQGTDLMHSHIDNRIHVEGVLLDKREASLGAFFYAVKGSLSDDGIKVPTDQGLVAVHDGDACNEKPAKLYVFVNGKLIDNPAEYVISPYEKIPPGDKIKFMFTEKQMDEINPNLK